MSLVFIPSDGFGNIMFQHHAAYAFAKENGLELCAPGWYYDVRPKFGEYSKLFSHVKMLGQSEEVDHPPLDYFRDPQRYRILNSLKYTSERNVYVDPQHPYTPIPKEARILSGYFQSWRYFDKFRIEIRDLLRSNESELFNRIKNKQKPGICVHIRWGGDGTLKPTIHTITSMDYYEKSMRRFPTSHFIVFCEDKHLIDNWPIWKEIDVEFSTEVDPVSTMFSMSLCDHFIIANSSLSLSAYYMRENENARILAPNDWFGSDGPAFKMEDLVKDFKE